MAKQYVPCPACGALGEIGSNCQFCNTTIVQKEGVIASETRLVERRTVTPQQYAEKISIYHDIKSLSETYSQVSIGDQKGIINLNGDLILPLEDIGENINFEYASSIAVAYERTFTTTEKVRNWRHEDDPLHEKKYIDETYTDYITLRYLNLNTLETATSNGFITDKDNPKKLHYIDLENWTIKNEYINHKGENKTYDYAEVLNHSHLPHNLPYDCKFYIFHQENSLSLCIINGKSYVHDTIEYLEDNQNHERLGRHIIFLEGIEAIGKLKETNMCELFLPIKLLNGKKFNLKIGTLFRNKYIMVAFNELNSIWDQWLTATEEENPFDKIREEERKEREEEERIKQQEEQQQRKYLKTLKIKRGIAMFFAYIAGFMTFGSIPSFFVEDSTLAGIDILLFLGGLILGIISIGVYYENKPENKHLYP